MEESILPHNDFDSDSDSKFNGYCELQDVKPILCRGCNCCLPNLSEYLDHQSVCIGGENQQSTPFHAVEKIKTESTLENVPPQKQNNLSKKIAKTKKVILKKPKGFSRFYCDICDVYEPTWIKLREHKKEHADKVRYLCDQCGYFTLAPWKLELHKAKHKDVKEKLFKCYICGAMLRTHQGFKTHLQIHQRVCPTEISEILDSGFSFTDVSTTNKDQEEEQSNCKPTVTYNCEECAYSTTTSIQLSIHKISHIDESEITVGVTYKCKECDFTTTNFVQFTQHKLIHAENNNRSNSLNALELFDPKYGKIYKCEQCIFQTHIRQSMVLHKMVHEKYKPIKCHECTEICKGAEALENHMKMVHQKVSDARMAKTYSNNTPVQVKYNCKECDFSCSIRKDFVRHRAGHGIHPYHCRFCGARFKYGGNILYNHIRRWHYKQFKESRNYGTDASDTPLISPTWYTKQITETKDNEEDATDSNLVTPICFEANLLNVELQENIPVEPDWLEKVCKTSANSEEEFSPITNIKLEIE